MRILFADSLPEQMLKDLQGLGFVVDSEPSLNGESLVDYAKSTQPDILVVRSTKVPAEVLQCGSIVLVIRAGAGVNNIDVEAASKLGIYVTNCPGKNAIAVAEVAMGHIIAIDRNIVDGTIDIRNGIWNKKKYAKGKGLFGNTLGIIGVGEIGKEVIYRAKSFGMNVVAWSRSLTPAKAKELEVAYAENIYEIAKVSEVISIHVALTPDTKHIISKEFFDAMKPNSYLVNTSRGEVVDDEALIEAMNNKNIRVGLDVWTNQPSAGEGAFSNSIHKHPNVQGTHHVGASTEQAQQAVADETYRILSCFKTEGQVLNCINIQKDESQNTLIIRHENTVGVLANILEQVRTENINVFDMVNVLFNGELAACVTIQLSKEPTEKLLETLRANKSVLSVRKM